jgi:phosphoadenosine phosphosulfate reductase
MESAMDLNNVILLNREATERASDARAVLARAYDLLGDELVLASSFSVEDMALIHIACSIVERPRVFTLDTGRLHEETYRIMEEARKKYPIRLEVHTPDRAELESLLREKGLYSFYESIENRKECCRIRKVVPLQRALSSCRGWATGLRSAQSNTRLRLAPFELDTAHGDRLKINPLHAWSDDDLWSFIRENGIPYNSLHDAGFPSIGCAPCTRAVQPGEDIRAGRWWWELPEHKECGLHQ